MTRARILADYVAGGTTAAEFDYLDGVTSNVQTQMDAKAPLASPTFTGTTNVASGVTLPSGHVANIFRYTDTSGNMETTANNGTPTIACTPMSFSATSGRHYLIFGSQKVITSNETGANHTKRIMRHALYYGTTARSKSDTSVDTRLSGGSHGRTQSSNSTAGYSEYKRISYQGYFTAGSTATHYVYTTICNDDTNTLKNYADNNATDPHIITVYEVMP